MWLSMMNLVNRRISRHKWKALPNLDFFLSLVVLERVEDKILEKLLVAHPDLDGLPSRAMLSVPGLDQRNVYSSPGPA